MLSGIGYNVQDDRQEAFRVLFRHGPQVGESTNENDFCETTERDCP
jgi:hypothetical protein